MEHQQNIENQLADIRYMKHDAYIHITGSRDDHNVSKQASIDRGLTPAILIKDNLDIRVHKDHIHA